MEPNPFYHTAPIREREYFYNREGETDQAIDRLRHMQSLSITGPRKIGKTSLLIHLQDETVRAPSGHSAGLGLDPNEYLFVYVNCEGLGSLRAEEMYELLLEEMIEGLDSRCTTPEIPVVSKPITFHQVRRFVRWISKQGLKLILALDEFEWVSGNQHLDPDFFSSLRALSHHVAYVTTSRQPLISLPHTDLYSPFFNIFTRLPLGLFNVADSRALVEGCLAKAKLELGADTIDLILELGGGHPFFLQIAGYYAYELRRMAGRFLDERDYPLLKDHARLQMAQHFQYIWEHLDPVQRYTLATLPLAQKASHLKASFRQLAEQALAVPKDDGWCFFSPLFQEFVRTQPVENVLNVEPFLLELEQKQALVRGHPLDLSPSQFALLAYLIQHRERVVTHAELDREIWQLFDSSPEAMADADTERVKSMIKHLRKALSDDSQCIATVRGVGYTFRLS
jgi:DNA-binding winged helix-turn-helix (wHTH) protein